MIYMVDRWRWGAVQEDELYRHETKSYLQSVEFCRKLWPSSFTLHCQMIYSFLFLTCGSKSQAIVINYGTLAIIQHTVFCFITLSFGRMTASINGMPLFFILIIMDLAASQNLKLDYHLLLMLPFVSSPFLAKIVYCTVDKEGRRRDKKKCIWSNPPAVVRVSSSSL